MGTGGYLAMVLPWRLEQAGSKNISAEFPGCAGSYVRNPRRKREKNLLSSLPARAS